MSRKKHNVSYIKPNEPKFLRELKEQIGYKEGPTIDTKREILPQDSNNDEEEREEEKPVVVVLNSEHLTAKQAEAYKKKKEEEEANAPADLSKRIIFRKNKITEAELETANKPVKKKIKKTKQEKVILSFNENDDDNL
ncbi:hypothetical protein HZU73_07093 [Apis mellifera caucasica]|uniref:Uncharacterized protein KIAA1143 homolog n=1 Tax=Apis mellifera TaxID=7460 RepID=A0A7M7MGV8_APIME|nr:uncharacterized protein KIAA1143 homolog [Apis mellifera]KAG6797773.1 hypothetical protein HZU73_07093 [Apis mellifera caucasica]|eukprot:XP_026296616.1 uncharacterized protein KIAA1143 homolog [Apis mellifera]